MEDSMAMSVVTDVEMRPFSVEIPDDKVVELCCWIGVMCWPSRELVADWSQGV